MKIQTYSNPAGFEFSFLALPLFSRRKWFGLNRMQSKKKKKHAHRQTCTAQYSLHDFQQHECCSLSAFQVLEAGKFWMKSQDSSPNILPALSSSVLFCFLHKGFGSIMYLWPSYIGFININTKWCNFTLGKGSSIYQRVILMCLRFYFIDSCISLTHVNSHQLCAHCERHAYLWRFQIMHYVGITHTQWLKKTL